jgi:hypothetical protein
MGLHCRDKKVVSVFVRFRYATSLQITNGCSTGYSLFEFIDNSKCVYTKWGQETMILGLPTNTSNYKI